MDETKKLDPADHAAAKGLLGPALDAQLTRWIELRDNIRTALELLEEPAPDLDHTVAESVRKLDERIP